MYICFYLFSPVAYDLFLHLLQTLQKETLNFSSLIQDILGEPLHFVHFFCFQLQRSLEFVDLHVSRLVLTLSFFGQYDSLSVELCDCEAERLLQCVHLLLELGKKQADYTLTLIVRGSTLVVRI